MEFFEQLPNIQKLFLISAIIGGALFILLILLQLIGGASETLGGDGDLGESDVSDVSFKFLSFQGLTAFFMMFGLSGMAFMREFQLPMLASVGAATFVGIASVWVIKKLFQIFRGFESSGTANLEHAIGQEGTVYLGIPANGIGKVQITLKGSLRTMNALSTRAESIESGSQVRVTAISNGNVLKVEPLS